jgi:hypothetical protein
MTIAIMQPYFFPYIGYFQLIHAVDTFVFLDDVAYIKGGWINRNRILINNQPTFITIPVKNSSQNRLICDTVHLFDNSHQDKMIETLRRTYGHAPFFSEIFSGLCQELTLHSESSIAALASKSVTYILEILAIKTRIVPSSGVYKNRQQKGRDRLIDICRKEQADTYINPPGGKSLYHKDDFLNEGITLKFIEPQLENYPQFTEDFIPGLSIIDVLMFNGIKKTKNMIKKYGMS